MKSIFHLCLHLSNSISTSPWFSDLIVYLISCSGYQFLQHSAMMIALMTRKIACYTEGQAQPKKDRKIFWSVRCMKMCDRDIHQNHQICFNAQICDSNVIPISTKPIECADFTAERTAVAADANLGRYASWPMVSICFRRARLSAALEKQTARLWS